MTVYIDNVVCIKHNQRLETQFDEVCGYHIFHCDACFNQWLALRPEVGKNTNHWKAKAPCLSFNTSAPDGRLRNRMEY